MSRSSPIVRGTIILGKANLTEFCGLKTPLMPPGWFSVGGQTQSPYVARHIAKKKLHWELSAPGGSSTGSAVSVAAGFSTLAIGTDTIGFLITPASIAALYGLKPTVGEVPTDGIFTLSKTFDAVGGMAKSAKDLVYLMDALMLPVQQEFGTRCMSRSFKVREGWGDLRIGFTEPTIWKSWRKNGRINADAEHYMVMKYENVVKKLTEIGLDVAHGVELPSLSSLNLDGRNTFEPIVYHEFKECLNDFIRSFELTKVRSLAEIINFNLEHPELTLPPSSPNQGDLMNALQSIVLKEHVQHAKAYLKRVAGREGLDRIFEENQFDIIAAPSDSALASLAAAAGYPTAIAPPGALKLNGQPFGLILTSPPHTESTLLHFLTAYEATFPLRALPLPLDAVPL